MKNAAVSESLSSSSIPQAVLLRPIYRRHILLEWIPAELQVPNRDRPRQYLKPPFEMNQGQFQFIKDTLVALGFCRTIGNHLIHCLHSHHDQIKIGPVDRYDKIWIPSLKTLDVDQRGITHSIRYFSPLSEVIRFVENSIPAAL